MVETRVVRRIVALVIPFWPLNPLSSPRPLYIVLPCGQSLIRGVCGVDGGSHGLLLLGKAWIAHVRHGGIRQIHKKLCKTAFRCGVVSENGRECRVPEWLRQALSESLTRSGIVAQSITCQFNSLLGRKMTNGILQYQGGTHLRKHLTTCLSSRAVCCSTSWLTMLLRTVPTA